MATTPGLPVDTACIETPAPSLPSLRSAKSDGPEPVESVAPQPAPPGKNLGEISQAVDEKRLPFGGQSFRDHPERIWRWNRPKKPRVRLIPRPSGWRPYHGNSSLSEDDVTSIRDSALPLKTLARWYGISLGTVRDIRSFRRGSRVRRAEDELDPAAIRRDLAAEILAALRRAERRLAEARARDRLERACRKEQPKPKAVPHRRYPLKLQTKRAWAR
jgi:hypothetical protein